MMYKVMLFKNVTTAMKAEKMLISTSVPHKLIPVPKSISADCGVCLRFEVAHEATVLKVLESAVDFVEVRNL